MQIFENPPYTEWSKLLERPVFDASQLEDKVKSVMEDIRKNGDAAVRKYTAMFDHVELEDFCLSETEIAEGCQLVDPELKDAIKTAKKNITKFHAAQAQPELKVETMPGVVCKRKSVAIDKVGLYIPGGSAPLFSTILMLAIPAQIAGCKEIVLCTPPCKDGKIDPAVLYTASLLELDKVYKIGGVQAVAAMSFGTETVPKVYKIFGPGNQYVTCAKQLATRYGLSIDMPAGPSEVLVFADEKAKPEFVAADLLSQAEHGPDSQVILVSTSMKLIERALLKVEEQLQNLDRRDIALQALANSKAIYFPSLDDSISLINDYAPEHLILSCAKNEKVAERITNAGSVFMGNFTPESAGDYASGTNHTLPTHGYATTYSGVSLDSFVKKITYQKISKQGLLKIGPMIEKMAAAEQLDAHKNAVTVRLERIKNQG